MGDNSIMPDTRMLINIRARLATLIAEQEQVRIEAEKRLFAYAAVIGELEALIAAAQGDDT